MYIFLNRCGFRLPSKWCGTSRGTGPHLDLNPLSPFSSSSFASSVDCLTSGTQESITPLLFWQPIQAFVAVTDNTELNRGGFCSIPGFHLKCFDFFRAIAEEEIGSRQSKTDGNGGPCRSKLPLSLKRGNAFEISWTDFPDLLEKVEHIPVKAGSMLFFDWRMLHGNEDTNDSDTVREVCYIGHLPDVPVNRAYVEAQLKWWKQGIHPPYMSKKFSQIEQEKVLKGTYSFTDLGKKLMGLSSWEMTT